MIGEAEVTNLVIDIDWAAMSASEQKAYFAENGFLVISGAIGRDKLAEIHRDIRTYGLTGLTEDIWAAPSIAPLIENPKLVSVLQDILGEEVLFFKGAYVETPPRKIAGASARPKVFHVDYGVGEQIGDFRNSCASWINVGHYLTDITPELAPLWVVPGSNRDYSIVPDSNMEHLAGRARMVLAKAGDAILIHCMTVHAGGHNDSDQTRHAVFLSYRPVWARPVGRVRGWPKKFIESAPPERKKLLVGLDRGISYHRSKTRIYLAALRRVVQSRQLPRFRARNNINKDR